MRADEQLVREVWMEMDELWQDSFQHGGADVDIPKLAVDWRAYIDLNKQGMVKLYTVREDTRLQGFVMYLVYPHMNHIGTTNADCLALIVRLDERNKGLGRALMEHAEPKLKEQGVHFITHHHRTCYSVEPLFPKLGYKLVELDYLKDIR